MAFQPQDLNAPTYEEMLEIASEAEDSYNRGIPSSRNPYPRGTDAAIVWDEAYDEAYERAKDGDSFCGDVVVGATPDLECHWLNVRAR